MNVRGFLSRFTDEICRPLHTVLQHAQKVQRQVEFAVLNAGSEHAGDLQGEPRFPSGSYEVLYLLWSLIESIQHNVNDTLPLVAHDVGRQRFG